MIPNKERLLLIAKNQAKRIPIKDKYYDKKKYLNNAIVIITMSAAAIESTINEIILAPTLLISERKTRIYFGELVSQFLKSPIRTKIQFVLSAFDFKEVSQKTKEEIQQLFSLRNKIVHSSPKFLEQHYLPEDLNELEDEFELYDLPTKPSLLTDNVYDEIIDISLHLLKTTESFIKSIELNNKRLLDFLKDIETQQKNAPDHAPRGG